MRNIELAKVQIDLDWFNLMAYNFHDPFNKSSNKVTNFNAPLYGSPQDPTPGYNIDAAVQNIIQLGGVKPRKIVLGIPAYAHSYAGVEATNGGLYQSYDGPGPGTHQPGILTYKDMMDNYLPTCDPPAWDDISVIVDILHGFTPLDFA